MKDALVEEFKTVWGVFSIELTHADVGQGCGRICQSDGEVVRMVLNLLSLASSLFGVKVTQGDPWIGECHLGRGAPTKTFISRIPDKIALCG